MKTPAKGDISAIPLPAGGVATGNVGVVFNVGSTISANDIKVVWNDWGFRPGQAPVFRRWVGR